MPRGVLLAKPAGMPTGRQIAAALGLRRGTASFFGGSLPGELCIRWGGCEIPGADTGRTLNTCEAIRRASGKLGAFQRFRDAQVPIPRFSASASEARAWQSEGSTVLGRTTEGFQGRGIRVYQPLDTLGQHPLYVEYVPNEREYRLHVVRGAVVSVQRKYLEYPERRHSDYIKNVPNGYVFKTPRKELNGSRKEAAIKATEALGLDFGAVDLLVGGDNKEYVLEVNTAPALSPMRIDQYVRALRPLLDNHGD